MSRETLQWLNSMTLIGFTEKRGNAWHYQEAMQGDEPNHYTGPVPVEDVRRRLFDWQADSVPLFVRDPATLNRATLGYVQLPDRQAIVRSDTGDVLGIFKSGYQPHQYGTWLVKNVENILDDDLGIGSAGLLRNGGQAWVSVEVPENIETPEGVTFRPNLIAATSFDGSLATTYKRAVTNVVCDNTLAAGLGEKNGQVYRVKHTRHSDLKVAGARDALAIVHETVDDFMAEVAQLANWDVTTSEFGQVLDVMIPLTDQQGQPLVKRSLTLAESKRDQIADLYYHDNRAAPWNGTALGVLQAFNTYGHHYQTVRGGSRVQRNRENAITGRQASADADVLKALAGIAA